MLAYNLAARRATRRRPAATQAAARPRPPGEPLPSLPPSPAHSRPAPRPSARDRASETAQVLWGDLRGSSSRWAAASPSPPRRPGARDCCLPATRVFHRLLSGQETPRSPSCCSRRCSRSRGSSSDPPRSASPAAAALRRSRPDAQLRSAAARRGRNPPGRLRATRRPGTRRSRPLRRLGGPRHSLAGPSVRGAGDRAPSHSYPGGAPATSHYPDLRYGSAPRALPFLADCGSASSRPLRPGRAGGDLAPRPGRTGGTSASWQLFGKRLTLSEFDELQSPGTSSAIRCSPGSSGRPFHDPRGGGEPLAAADCTLPGPARPRRPPVSPAPVLTLRGRWDDRCARTLERLYLVLAASVAVDRETLPLPRHQWPMRAKPLSSRAGLPRTTGTFPPGACARGRSGE